MSRRGTIGSYTRAKLDQIIRRLISQNSSGGGGAPTDASYVVTSAESGLTDERVLTAGSGISLVDGGAGSPVTISTTDDGLAPDDAPYIVTAGSADLTSERILTAGSGISLVDGGAGNSITISTTDDGLAPDDAPYIVTTASADLTSERILTAGSGISIVDGGAGSPITISATGGSSTRELFLAGDMDKVDTIPRTTAGTVVLYTFPWTSRYQTDYTKLRITAAFARNTGTPQPRIQLKDLQGAATYNMDFTMTGSGTALANYEIFDQTVTLSGNLSATDTIYQVDLIRNGVSGVIYCYAITISIES